MGLAATLGLKMAYRQAAQWRPGNPCRLEFRPRALAALTEKLLGLRPLAAIYDRLPENLGPVEFLRNSLDALGVRLKINNPQSLEQIPREGPLLVVANHPLGGLEGMALAQTLLAIRPDLRLLTNELLRRIPELADIFIGVDVLSADAASGNIRGVKQVHRHLRGGGAVLIFPAGMVSAIESRGRRIQDRKWNRLAGQLIKRHQCACLPVWVHGRNSVWFYLAGLIHPRLRTVLLPRQLANKRGFQLEFTLGKPVLAQELRLLQTPGAVTEYLRVSSEALARRDEPVAANFTRQVDDIQQLATTDSVAAALAQLEEFRLIEHGDFDVYCAPHGCLGIIMEMIAVAREISFRAVGEGTGLTRDSDQFDPHYLHLFLWDKANSRIAGAYRVGLVDEIIAEHGVKGLYSRSLYRYDNSFIKRLGSAIEMGRSFIHPDYQRRPESLTLLWRGIGRLLVERPQYHTLFGSVSISREYSDLARALIADTLLTNFEASEFVPLVKPLTPLKIAHRVWSEDMLNELVNIKMLGKLIGRCDPGKAVPVLLRHYLSLNGRMVCFNIHMDFNNSLEGLIIVDVRRTDPKTVARFMGAAGAEKFYACHKLADLA